MVCAITITALDRACPPRPQKIAAAFPRSWVTGSVPTAVSRAIAHSAIGSAPAGIAHAYTAFYADSISAAIALILTPNDVGTIHPRPSRVAATLTDIHLDVPACNTFSMAVTFTGFSEKLSPNRVTAMLRSPCVRKKMSQFVSSHTDQ